MFAHRSLAFSWASLLVGEQLACSRGCTSTRDREVIEADSSSGEHIQHQDKGGGRQQQGILECCRAHDTLEHEAPPLLEIVHG